MRLRSEATTHSGSTLMKDKANPPPAQYEIEPRDGYLYVALIGALGSEAKMHAYQQDIEAASKPELRRCVLFDNRQAQPSTEDIRAGIWTWASSTSAIQRAAVVAHTSRVHRRVERTAELNRVRMAAFGSIEEAERWLRSGRSAAG